jgi:hypothetical protein
VQVSAQGPVLSDPVRRLPRKGDLISTQGWSREQTNFDLDTRTMCQAPLQKTDGSFPPLPGNEPCKIPRACILPLVKQPLAALR